MADASRVPDTMRWSLMLIGLAIAIAGGVGVFLPVGHRWAVLLPLLAGIGVGVAGLAIGSPDVADADPGASFERVFFNSSVAGFITVIAGLVLVWLRARPASTAGPTDQPTPRG